MKTTNLLITGCPRSGTTFLGKVLALPPQVGYVREPLNSDFGLEQLERQFIHLYEGMPDQHHYDQMIKDLIEGRARFKQLPVARAETWKRRLGRMLFRSGSNYSYLQSKYNPIVNRLLFKDPMASLSSEYLHQIHGLQVVVIVRHPFPTLASMERVNVAHNLRDLIAQPELYNTYLRDILGNVQIDRLPVLEQRALLWLSINHVLMEYAQRNPGFVVVRYKDLALDPVGNFPELFRHLELEYNQRIEAKIQQMTAAGNPGMISKQDRMHVLNRDSR